MLDPLKYLLIIAFLVCVFVTRESKLRGKWNLGRLMGIIYTTGYIMIVFSGCNPVGYNPYDKDATMPLWAFIVLGIVFFYLYFPPGRRR